MNLLTLSSALAVISGLIFNMYDGVAVKYGYPIGKLFLKYKTWLVVIGWLMIVSGSIEIISQVSILLGLIIILGCIFFAVSLIALFKSNIQWISLLMVITSVIIWILGGASIQTV